MAEGRDDQFTVLNRGEMSTQDNNENSKKFDAFFSYNENDAEIVLNALKELEQPPYSLKICQHKRDFEVGAEILDNIGKFMFESKKIVIFLSKSFIKSGWCSYESNYALQLSLGDFKKTVIPILLEDCAIPNSLGCLTYLDFTKSFSLEQLAEALKEENFQGRSFFVRASATDRFSNGEIICTLSPKTVESGIKFNDNVCPVSLLNDIGLTKPQYKNIISKVNELPLVQFRLRPLLVECAGPAQIAVFITKYFSTIFLTFLMIFSFLSWIVIIANLDPYEIYWLLIPSIAMFIGPCMYFKCANKINDSRTNLDHEKKEITETVLDINRGIRDKNILIFYSPVPHEVDIMFFRSNDCQKYLVDKLSSSNLFEDQLTSREAMQSLNKLVEKTIKDNIIEVYASREKITSDIRHIKQGVCSCQFLEETYFKSFFACMEAVNSNEENQDKMAQKLKAHFSINLKSGFENGHVITKLFAQQKKSCFPLGLKFKCPDVLPDFPDTLSESRLKKTVMVAENLPYFRYFNLVRLTPKCSSVVAILLKCTFSYFLSLYILNSVSFRKEGLLGDFNLFVIILLPSTVLAIILHYLMQCLVLRLHRVSTRKYLERLNTELMSDNLACHIDDLKIVFLHHFMDPCRKNIREMIRKKCLDEQGGIDNNYMMTFSYNHDLHSKQCQGNVQRRETNVNLEELPNLEEERQNMSQIESENSRTEIDVRLEEQDEEGRELNTHENKTDELVRENMFEYLQYRSKNVGHQDSILDDSHTLHGMCFCMFVRRGRVLDFQQICCCCCPLSGVMVYASETVGSGSDGILHDNLGTTDEETCVSSNGDPISLEP